MLKSLYIKNIALIDELNIEFASGLNVLSGETGAGKSIIIDSVNLILGERADKELIRKSAQNALVEGTFLINASAFTGFFEENGIEAEDEVVISRSLTVSGKNVCRINGTMVNLATLKSFSDRIVDLHGQHEHQSLLYKENHLKFVDAFANNDKQKEKIAMFITEYSKIKKQLNSIGSDETKRQSEIDFLTFQINEVESANVVEGEKTELKNERNILANAEKIYEVLNSGYEGLYNGTEYSTSALSVIKNTADALNGISDLSENYKALCDRIWDSYYTLEECAHEMNSLSTGVEFDEKRQEEVEKRIELLNTLFRKYGSDEKEVLTFLEKSKNRLEDLINSEGLLIKLNQDKQNVYAKLYEQYEALAISRKKAGEKIAKLLIDELKDLGMANTRFETIFKPLPTIKEEVISGDGLDEGEFFISTNVGEELKPLSKTASGGEISRIMLAFKNISAGLDNISTLIFDEIDTGISGKMAQVVAKKMAQISKTRQVICVTHLPQIASMADKSFLIEKNVFNNNTNTNIKELDEEEKTIEIVRLIGGIDSENAKIHAKELIENAKKLKESI